MPTLFYRNQEIPYTLKVSRKRRTLALQVGLNQQVTVLAPLRLPAGSIERFIQKQFDWIWKKRQHFSELACLYPAKTYVSGETFLVRGQPCHLDVVIDGVCRRPHVHLEENRLVVKVSAADQVRKALLTWYKGEAEQVIHQAVDHWAPRVGATPKRIAITNPQRRWGSCSSRGHLRFNWRVAMMPDSIVDSIVVHELAHLKVHNHSARFWAVVQAALPDYKQSRQWLRTHGFQLSMV